MSDCLKGGLVRTISAWESSKLVNEVKGNVYYVPVSHLLLRALNLLFQNFKPVCRNIGNSNRREIVEKIR